MKFASAAFTFLIILSGVNVAAAPNKHDKQLIDYFLPMPIEGKLTSDIWGAPNVLPRDPDNGLEDPTNKQYYYWDGKILKGPDGKYHMFASRWDQSLGHGGWIRSVAVHAVSDNAMGPYKDTGMTWPDDRGGRGHNVTALQLPDKRYAVVVSETRPGGTVNHWEKMERPNVYLENGHVKYFTFAVIDVPKEEDKGNDNHGSKVLVVPFDGGAFDRDTQKIVKAEKREAK